jgi:hypothetical protein
VLNGVKVPIHRISSDPPTFKLEDGFDATDIDPSKKWASSDGYWVFLKPLPSYLYATWVTFSRTIS